MASELRFCSCCREAKPPCEYYPKKRGSPHLKTQCKTCFVARRGLTPVEKSDALYVMGCSVLPGAFKVGRSANVEARAKELQTSQPYYVSVLATFPHQGAMESAVHADLAYCRVIAPGREWFEAPLADILHTIGLRIAGPPFLAHGAH